MADTLDSTLTARLREVVASGDVTESELRKLGEQAEGWARVLEGQIRAEERRLARLTADPGSPVAEIAEALRRVEALRSELGEARGLRSGLDARARELRAAWLRAARERQPAE